MMTDFEVDSTDEPDPNKYKYILHAVLALTLGIGLITGSSYIGEKNRVRHVLDELGFAMIVAAAVTLMYETYAREVLSHETMKRVLEDVMGDMFHSQLWKELRTQLLSKTAIRKAFTIRLFVEHPDELPEHKAVLWASVSYRLHVFRARTDKVRVLHYLDGFMRDDALDLPRFDLISIGSHLVDLKKVGYLFDENVDMSGHGHHGLPIVVERHELMYLPGAYNLVMSDLTELESIQILSMPKGFKIETNWTIGEHSFEKADGCAINRMLLPGHSIEIRLVRKEHTTTEAKSSPTGNTLSGSATAARHST